MPKSTVYYWAREEHLVPSISATSVMLWSYKDLLALRTIYWLRQPKKRFDIDIPPTSMRKVRRALREIQALDLELFENGRPVVAVALDGSVLIDAPSAGPLQSLDGQFIKRELVDVVAPFEAIEGGKGPHLQRPRPLLRIVPRKLGGAPHVDGTRVESESLFALEQRGFDARRLLALYPFLSADAVRQSIDLEQQLQHNLSIRRAA